LQVAGKLATAKAVLKTVVSAKEAGGDLHLTPIRNGNSYFGYLQTLLESKDYLDTTNATPGSTIYVIGDSHILTPAWRTITTTSDKKHLLKPLLVTGCKIWHLRKESHFYPKVNFFQALKLIPKHSTAIILLGEIDCREGILMALAKGLYTSIEDAFAALVDIYVDLLQQVVAQRRLTRLYVHPIPPVLDETRALVAIFNRALSAKLIKLKQNEPKTPIRWLHIETELLTLGRENLQENYKLDGSHLHPSYLSLIENAMNTLEEYH
jgi:hypothetical protein